MIPHAVGKWPRAKREGSCRRRRLMRGAGLEFFLHRHLIRHLLRKCHLPLKGKARGNNLKTSSASNFFTFHYSPLLIHAPGKPSTEQRDVRFVGGDGRAPSGDSLRSQGAAVVFAKGGNGVEPRGLRESPAQRVSWGRTSAGMSEASPQAGTRDMQAARTTWGRQEVRACKTAIRHFAWRMARQVF